MTVINTNVGALTARTYALAANDSMQTAMERLSSGLRINSAADDAAGMAVSNKMESQLRGMNVAIRNSQDGISLVQTAEAGMSEITNMIIRMRELSVQMNNGVYTDGDRTNAQLEVTALLAEIDKIADNTAFNNVKVLDGTYATDIRAGNTNIETITVAIASQATDALGAVAEETVAASSVATGTRTDNGDGTQTSALNVEASSALTVNLSTESTAFVTDSGTTSTYTLTGADSGDFAVDASTGVITSSAAVAFDETTADNNSKALVLTIEKREDSVAVAADDYTSSTTGNAVTSSVSFEESDSVSLAVSADSAALVTAANASLNGAVRYELSGTDSAFFSMADNTTGVLTAAAAVNYSTTPASNSKSITLKAIDRIATNTVVAGTGGTSTTLGSAVTTSFNIEEADSFVVTESAALATAVAAATPTNTYYVLGGTDAANFTVDASNGTLTSVGAEDFDHATTGADNDRVVTLKVFDAAATQTVAAATGDFVSTTNGAQTATLDITSGASSDLSVASTNEIIMNLNSGFQTMLTNTSTGGDDGSGTNVLVGAINYSVGNFSTNAGPLTLSSSNVSIDSSTGAVTLTPGMVEGSVNADVQFDIVATDGSANVYTMTVSLEIVAENAIATEALTMNITESTVIAEDTITATITESAKHVDTIALNVTKAEDHLENVDVSTKAGAARAVTILDKALDEISSSQAKLGAIQNRLQHNIDNLSNGAMLTETARGRITDADFARETSELSKQQILGQAATSMLAQANQSKQSILALLQ